MVDVGKISPRAVPVLRVRVTLEEPIEPGAGTLVPTQHSEFDGDPVVGAAMLRKLADKYDPPKRPTRGLDDGSRLRSSQMIDPRPGGGAGK